MAMTLPQWDEQTRAVVMPDGINALTLQQWSKATDMLSWPVLKVDCSAVVDANSGLLALLMHWSVSSDERLQVINFPESLNQLIDLYGLASEVDFVKAE